MFDCPDGNVHLNFYQGGTYFDTQTYSYGYSTPSLTTDPDAGYGVAGHHKRGGSRLTVLLPLGPIAETWQHLVN